MIKYTDLVSKIIKLSRIMTGSEYQLYLSQPPLYIIRKVERKSPTEGLN